MFPMMPPKWPHPLRIALMTSPRERRRAHGTDSSGLVTRISLGLCQALHRNLPCRSQRRWKTTTYPKISWAFWRRKFAIWKSVRWVFGFGSRRTRVIRFVDHAMLIFAVLTGNNSILFAGKARFLQKTGGCWRNAEWRSKGAFIRGEFRLNFTCEINGAETGKTFVLFNS